MPNSPESRKTASISIRRCDSFATPWRCHRVTRKSLKAMYIRWYVCGEPDKALALADRLVELDPLTPIELLGPIHRTHRSEAICRGDPCGAKVASTRTQSRMAAPADRRFAHPDEPHRTKPGQNISSCPDDDLFRMSERSDHRRASRRLGALERTVSQIRKGSGDAAMFQYAQIYAQARQSDRAFDALDKGLKSKILA